MQYSVGARFSNDPGVAELQSALFDRAKREVELAPGDTARAYQAVQANSILSVSLGESFLHALSRAVGSGTKLTSLAVGSEGKVQQ